MTSSKYSTKKGNVFTINTLKFKYAKLALNYCRNNIT